MGCYLGDNVFVVNQNDCDVHIVSNGHMDVERTQFPSTAEYTVYILITTTCNSPVGGGMTYLEYYNGSTWIQLNSYPMTNAYSYAYVDYIITPNGWNGNMRIRWDGGCTKQWLQGTIVCNSLTVTSNLK